MTVPLHHKQPCLLRSYLAAQAQNFTASCVIVQTSCDGDDVNNCVRHLGNHTCMTSCLHLERASSAFSAGMSLMAASSCFLICLLADWFSTSSNDPKGTVMEAGRLMASGSLPLKPEHTYVEELGCRIRQCTEAAQAGKEHGSVQPSLQLYSPAKCTLEVLQCV